MNLIIADAPPLRGMRQRVQQLAMRFHGLLGESGGRLLYVDEPGNIVTVFLSPEKPLSNVWSWIPGLRIEPETGIPHFVPPAGLPFGYHSPCINNWNHFWYRVSLGNRFHKSNGPVVLIVCNVLGLGWLGRFGEDVVIYDCADEISEFRQARMRREAVRAQERELIRRADAVVTTSQRLFDAKSPHAKIARLIRNAADIKHFNRALNPGPRPADMAHLEKPVVGFYGYLADWLDWPLIERVVREGKEFDWVFIGPTTRSLAELEGLPNFHHLGRKPYSMLPDYLGHFACGHIPFDRTPLTLNVNPVKLYEYLAGGVPVVATPLPELEAFRDVCRLADDPGEYLEMVREEVASDSKEKRELRSERVADESWDSRVKDYCLLIRGLTGG
jgi:glycosyltransferase involved in cell wall biosynthesis